MSYTADQAEEIQHRESRDYITEAYSALDPEFEMFCDEEYFNSLHGPNPLPEYWDKRLAAVIPDYDPAEVPF